MNGLILLVFIAALAAFGWTRLRGKMNPLDRKSVV